jgi:hypothetical protein
VVVVTDKLRSYGIAQRQLLPSVEHRQSRYLNNRAENSHRPRAEESGKCNGSNHPNKPRTSSPLTHSSTAISILADVDSQSHTYRVDPVECFQLPASLDPRPMCMMMRAARLPSASCRLLEVKVTMPH